MNEYVLTLSLGLIVSLILYDGLWIAAGGMVVPGYAAYMLGNPLLLAISLAAGFVAFLLLSGMSRFAIFFGRRRFVTAILLGMAANFLVVHGLIFITKKPIAVPDFGYVVPGLLATWLDKQGIIATASALTIATVATALLVMFLKSMGM